MHRQLARARSRQSGRRPWAIGAGVTALVVSGLTAATVPAQAAITQVDPPRIQIRQVENGRVVSESPQRAPQQEPQQAPQRTSAEALNAALRRDLNLTTAQLTTRAELEQRAPQVTRQLQSNLGDDFAGSWVSADGSSLTVATTDRSHLDAIRAAGAEPRLVQFSVSDLQNVKTRLDDAARPDPNAVSGWYVDVPGNRVVVLARAGRTTAAEQFAGTEPSIAVVETDERPRLLYDVRGGDAYHTSQFRCSIGFSVEGGFVTAGHCGSAGESVTGYNRAPLGQVRKSSFPGNDYGWVAVESTWTPRPWVNDYAGGNVEVTGSQEAPVGAAVCRSGSTSGWRCGTIQARDQTVNYPEGTVSGLTRTTACAEPGDSGGSFVANGGQAQGVTSGGSGDCSVGGTSYFQPVEEILDAYGLKLVTTG